MRRAWRKEGTAHDPKLTSSYGTRVHDCHWTASFVFICAVSSRMNSGVHEARLFALIQPDASKLIGQLCTVQMDNNPTLALKKKKECSAMPRSIAWCESNKGDAFHLMTANICRKALTEHCQGWNPVSGEVYGFQTRGSLPLAAKGFATEY